MMKIRLERLPGTAAVALTVVVVAACAIRLRGDESTPRASGLAPKAEAAAAKLDQCRTATEAQKEAFLECRKIWAEQRSRFLGGTGSSNGSESRTGCGASAAPLPRKDESRLPSALPSIPSQSE
ncbi:putative entry exclusion protein TrbK-alt [Bradyrhizobium sacchari]|uniref:Conjugative transfer region protein TrbK n=1 Tax=Bradyrhizobium sacchari TaxID=1399419 RepID=A0A560JF09_9BRAD|nr:putative entry exclusion protein TrbK-alt [Bradyrhizobium sacchari]TWB51381.1 conjugative transfer region protein TrbK [Bradyrhizobium sacchari]TWB69616.1 conjugative transfer region protein TrbK [Bradyrhizobium sacchari]